MKVKDTILGNLRAQYYRRRLGEVLLLAIGGGLLTRSLLLLLGQTDWQSWFLPALATLGLFIFRYRQLGLHRLSEQDIAIFLNRRYAQLQDSADLLTAAPETLRPLQQVQRQRLLNAIGSATRQIDWPQQWTLAGGIFLLGLLGWWFSADTAGKRSVDALPAVAAAAVVAADSTAETAAELSTHQIQVRPPVYTGRGAYRSEAFDLQVPEGSTVSWALTFSGRPEKVRLVFSDGDSTLLQAQGQVFSLSRSIRQSGFYSLQWFDRGALKTSAFYKLEVIEDQPPQVRVTNQEQFVELPWDEEITLNVQTQLSDDYGLTDAYAIATVSKGSGESVKFREERLAFNRPDRIVGKQVQASLVLNTKMLGMEPGDELYYYIQAWDNRSPQAQSNRTETFFVALQDTSTQMISFEGGLGVDLMPEYFRSQRQIIIDSEKLLAEKRTLQKKEFDRRSNDLAHDQKVLRLRYGQFLGEEFESGMTSQPSPAAEEAPGNEEEVLEQYGHAHDTDNEHNLVPEEHEHDHDHDHDHDHGETLNPEEQEESPLEAFAHNHDNMEEATFFIQSVKTKLRAALSMMWDAELHLRMNDPATSLPYQYKILKLLKEISQDSRIYVHRTGFDAPPLKEEKRLSGDLDEINNPRAVYQRSRTFAYPAIRRAAPRVEQWLRTPPQTLAAGDKELLAASGNELAAAAIEQPDRYLEPLSTLKRILDGELSRSNLLRIRSAFWRLLPELPRAPGDVQSGDHSLQRAFIQQLKVRR